MSQEEYQYLNQLSKTVVGAAIEVHKELGPGFYKGIKTDKTYRLDLLVEDQIIVEIKAVENLLTVHEIQLVTYLKLTGKHLGLLLNFNVPVLKDGIKRKINSGEKYNGIKPIRD